MVQRFVSVGDDFTLPPSVKAADGNLPARLGVASLNATYADAVDAFALNRLAIRGQEVASRSLSRSQIDYADAAGLDERWVNTSAWATGGNTFPVSAGKVYGPASGNEHMGIGVPVSSTGRGHYRTTLQLVPGGAERYVMAGWSYKAGGTQPALGDMLAVGFHVNAGGATYDIVTSRLGAIASPTLVSGLSLATATSWTFNIWQDETQVGITVTDSLGSKVYKIAEAKATFGGAQLSLRHEVGRGVSGDNFDRVVGQAAIFPHKSGYYASIPAVIWGKEPVGGQAFAVWLPPNYDPRRGAPLCIMPAGMGGNELSGASNVGSANDWAVTNALLQAGFMVTNSAANGGANVGNGYAHFPVLWRYLVDRFAVGRVVIWSTSFGGPSGLRMIKDREIPNIAAWVGTYPVTNLADVYANNSALASAIDAAWGSLAAAQAAGADPALYPATAFRGVRMHVRHSLADTTVRKVGNVDVLRPKVLPYTDVFTSITTTGAHGDNSNFTNLDTNEIAFLKKAVGIA